ncbi:hypothetical protein WDZ92_06615, partial [Nostoc sp. NIES-2111]
QDFHTISQSAHWMIAFKSTCVNYHQNEKLLPTKKSESGGKIIKTQCLADACVTNNSNITMSICNLCH